MRNNNSNNQQVALIQPTRMQMPAHVPEQYGLNDDSWRALVEGVFPLAKTVGAVLLALAYCEKNRLDIFQKPVHIVPMRIGRKEVETVWPGIAQIRVMAQRQPEFAGYDDCEFGPDIERKFKGKKQNWRSDGQGGWEKSGFEDIETTLIFPEWAQFIVYKMLHGQRVRLPGPKVWFLETFSGTGEGQAVPNDKWDRSPRQMIEKCAEAASYRRAFPDVLGNEMSAEEMEGKELMGHNGGPIVDADYVEVKGGGQEPAKDKAAAPKRSDFQQGDGDARTTAASGEARTSDSAAKSRVSEAQTSSDVADVTISEAVARRNRLLDGDSIPNNDQSWDDYERLLKERLMTFMAVSEVDAEQDRQQFRIDAAPMRRQQALYAMFADTAAELPAETRVSAQEAEQAGEAQPAQEAAAQGDGKGDLFEQGGEQ